MNKKVWLSGLSLLVLIFAVIYVVQRGNQTTNYDYVFTGAGEYWSAEYEQTAQETFQNKNNKVQYSSQGSHSFKLVYTRDFSELSALHKISYSFAGKSGGGSGTVEFPEPPKNKEVIRSNGSGTGFERKDSRIEVTVEWQGKKESFYLAVE